MANVLWLAALLTATAAVDLSLDYPEVSLEDRECHGTMVGFGYSGSREMHYHNLRKRYQDCTHVLGNLELTNLDDPDIFYDLSFLSKIRYVTGYVLIGLATEVPVIELPSLQVVRGNKTYAIRGGQYSFIVALTARTDATAGLRELHLPQLREISNGGVMFSQNPLLCYVNTISWEAIAVGKPHPVDFGEYAYAVTCENCTCGIETTGCWGQEMHLCQPVLTNRCHESCPHRCFAPGPEGCCSPYCAVSCWGSGTENCQTCKDFTVDGACVSHCPPKTYTLLQHCVPYE